MKLFDLKRFRLDKNIKQADLTVIFDCNQSFISSVETGKRKLPETMIAILQSKYGDISGYITETDSPGSPPETILKDVTPEEFMIAGADAFSRQIAKMMNDKLIAPYGMLEERDKEIQKLNRQIGRLEAEIAQLKKGSAQQGGNVICADVG